MNCEKDNLKKPTKRKKLDYKKYRCIECGINWADYPSTICVGCKAYRDHTGHF